MAFVAQAVNKLDVAVLPSRPLRSLQNVHVTSRITFARFSLLKTNDICVSLLINARKEPFVCHISYVLILSV